MLMRFLSLLVLVVAVSGLQGADTAGTPGGGDTVSPSLSGNEPAEDSDQSGCANQSYKASYVLIPSGGGEGSSYEDPGNSGEGDEGSSDSSCTTCQEGTSTPGAESDTTGDDPAEEDTDEPYGATTLCWPVVHTTHQETRGGSAPAFNGGAGGAGGGDEAGDDDACGDCGGGGALLPGGDAAPALGLPFLTRTIYTKDNQGLQPFGDQHHSWHLPLRLAYNTSAARQTITFLPTNGSVALIFTTTDHITFTRTKDKGRSVGGTCERVDDTLVITTEFGARYEFALPVDVTLASNRTIFCTRMVARTGAVYDLTYDGTRLIAVQGPLGALALTWKQVAGAWVIDRLTGFDGRDTVYEYSVLSGKPVLAAAVHPDGSRSTFTYDMTDVLLPHYSNAAYRYRVTRPNDRGRIRDLTYFLEKRLGRARLIEDAYGRDVYWRVANGWNGSLLWRQFVDQDGREKRFWFDGSARLVRVLDLSTGAEKVLSWNGNKQLVSVRDELGRVTRYDRLPNTFRIAATHFTDGSSASATWDDHAQYTSQTDRLGRTTQYVRDHRGLVTEIILPDTSAGDDSDNPRQLRAYNAIGQLTRSVDELGRESMLLYSQTGEPADAATSWDAADNWGFPVRKILPQDASESTPPVWTYRWDPVTKDLIATVDPLGRTTTFSYDLMHRLVQVGYADGSDEQVVFGDPTGPQAGLKVASKDRNDRWTTFAWNAAGQMTGRVLPDGTAITIERDIKGRTIARTVAGRRTTYAYDAAGRRSTQTVLAADGTPLTTTWIYDSQDRLVATRDPYGRMVGHVYDTNDRRVRTVQGLRPETLDRDAVLAVGAAERGAATPWTSVDVGNPNLAGSASVSGDEWTVTGGGADIWGSFDRFHFVSQPCGNDVILTARIDSQTVSDPKAKAGLMFRATPAANSAHAMLLVTPTSGVVFSTRAVPGGSTSSRTIVPPTSHALPVWVRLQRVHSDVVAFISADGVTWEQVGRNRVEWTTTSRIGLAVNARTTSALTTAVFAQVHLAKTPGLAPLVADLVWHDHVLQRNAGESGVIVMEQEFLANGLVAASIDGRGVRHESEYDVRNRLIESREAVGTPETAVRRFGYDAVGNQVLSIDAREIATTRSFTARNQVAQVIEAAGTPEAATTSMTYTRTDRLATRSDPRNPAWLTQFEYSACCERLVKVTDPSGAVTRYQYDAVGNRLAEIRDLLAPAADGSTAISTQWAYDLRNRVTAVANGLGETTTIVYDEDLTDGVGLDATYAAAVADLGFGPGHLGSAVAATDPAGGTRLEIRDNLGRVVRVVDANGHATTTQYDAVAAGLVVTTVIDAVGGTARQEQDGAGRVVRAIDAAGALTTMGFDANHNRTQILDAVGVGMTCTFDARNREVLCTDTRSDVLVERRTVYDANSNVVGVQDALGAWETSVYDARNRRVEHTDRIGAVTRFTYDAANNLLAIEDAEGGITEYAYDERNLLVQERFPSGQQGRTVRSYGYDAARRLLNRTVTTDPASGMTEVTQYGYDAASRLLVRGYQDGLNDTFAYDPASRLTVGKRSTDGTSEPTTYDRSCSILSAMIDRR